MKRSIDTSIWSDPWFTEISANAKMVFMYLLTNERSTAAGIFDLSPRRMAFDIGIDQASTEAALEECAGRVRWWPEHSMVWVVNFFRHQAVNDNFLKSAQKTFETLPEDIRVEVLQVYPEFDPNGIPTDPEPIPTGSGTRREPVPTGHQTNTHIDIDRDIETSNQGSENRVQGSVEIDAREKNRADPPERAIPISQPDPAKFEKRFGGVDPMYLVGVMCDELGVLSDDLSKRDRGKQSVVAKRLIAEGMTDSDIRGITNWLKSQDWVTSVDMSLIEKQRGKWILAGKPDISQAKAPPSQPTNQAALLREQAQRERAEYEQARSDRSSGSSEFSLAETSDNPRAPTGVFLDTG